MPQKDQIKKALQAVAPNNYLILGEEQVDLLLEYDNDPTIFSGVDLQKNQRNFDLASSLAVISTLISAATLVLEILKTRKELKQDDVIQHIRIEDNAKVDQELISRLIEVLIQNQANEEHLP